MFIDKDPQMLDAVRTGGIDAVNIFQVEFRPFEPRQKLISNRAINMSLLRSSKPDHRVRSAFNMQRINKPDVSRFSSHHD